MKKIALSVAVCSLVFGSLQANAADYTIDTKTTHAFVQFRIKHLGFSWLYGQFNDFSGSFSYDETKPESNKVVVDINVGSIDSHHAERDKHLRSKDFLDADSFPKAKFVSTAYKTTGKDTAQLSGDFTLHGVTKNISFPVEHIGGGNDPWGGYRNGFEGKVTIKPADYGVDLTKKLGASAAEVELTLSIEGVRAPEAGVKK